MDIEFPTIPYRISEAIARQEGFYINDTRANRNNNPGNVEFGPFAEFFGATSGDPRFAIFPNAMSGFNCLRALLYHHYKGLTIQEAIAKYAPAVENDVAAYVRDICNWTGLQSTTVIDEHI